MKIVVRFGLLVSLMVLAIGPAAAASGTTTGTIQGILGYPSEGIPAMRVYAIDVTNPARAYVIETPASPTLLNFTMGGLTPGTYYVLGYYRAPAGTVVGAYSVAVACGLSVTCTDHTLVPVTVTAGATTSGVQVRDYYAPLGTFPAEPVGAIPASAASLPNTGASAAITSWLLVVPMLLVGFALRMASRRSRMQP